MPHQHLAQLHHQVSTGTSVKGAMVTPILLTWSHFCCSHCSCFFLLLFSLSSSDNCLDHVSKLVAYILKGILFIGLFSQQPLSFVIALPWFKGVPVSISDSVVQRYLCHIQEELLVPFLPQLPFFSYRNHHRHFSQDSQDSYCHTYAMEYILLCCSHSSVIW